MNNCEIVQDLLPLYKDEVVSASTVAMIEEHLKTCETCKGELAKLQGDVKVSFEPTQKAEIGALMLFRRKMLRKNVIIACVSAVLGVALLLGTYLYLDNNTTIIPYEDCLIVDVHAFPDRGIIDIISSVKPKGWNVSSIMVNENGENIKLMIMSFSESIISRWQNNRNGHIEYSFQVLQPMIAPQPDPEDKPGAYPIYEPFDRCEVYYINEPGVNPEMDYQRLRHEGNLVWSGTFEGSYNVGWKSYGLENATERQFAERMVQFSLYTNGTMSFAMPLVSSYIPPRCTYSNEGDEMVFRAIIKTERDRSFFGLEDGDIVARFTIIDENTLVFHSAEVALFAEPNGRYVAFYPDEQSSALPVYNLTNSGKLTANAQDISDYWLYTNSEKITVFVSGDVVNENARITLYDTDGMNDIMVMQINPSRMTGVFTNLTSAKNYYVIATGLDGCKITLSD